MFGVRFRLQALLVGIALACVHATKPDGYVAPPRQPDPHPPKYEYGYAVGSSDGGDSIATNGTRSNAGQGHREFRDGDNTHGNYYVNFADGEAQQSVQYIADDWGYHPVVRYFSHNDHSEVSSHFALGESAVDRLRSDRQQQEGPLNHPQHTLGPVVQVIPMQHFVPPPPPPSPAPPHFHSRPQQQPTSPPPLAGPLQYNPDQLQIIGVIPQEFPAALLHRPLSSNPHSTVIYPVTDSPSVVQHFTPAPAEDETLPSKSSSALLNKTHSLINGYDVIDINHSAESVAQNTLFQAATSDDDQYDAASPAQRTALQQKQSNVAGFITPIVVDDVQQHSQFPATTESPEVSIKPGRARFSADLPKTPKQINLQIFDDHNNGQFLHEISSGGSTESSLTTQLRIPEAPSRIFLKNFQAPGKQSTQPAFRSSTSASTTLSAGYETTTELPTHSLNTHTIGVSKELNIKTVLLEREHESNLVYGARFFPRTSEPVQLQPNPEENSVEVSDEHITYVTTERTEQPTVIIQPEEPSVEIEQQVIVPLPTENYVEHSASSQSLQQSHQSGRTLDQIVNGHIDCPPEPVHSNYVIERIVDRPVERIVEKPVPFPYPVEVKQFVDRPYPVERIVEKEVPVPYAVEKIVDRPVAVETIVEKTVNVPVDRVVERIVEVPVPVEKIIDRPYPVEKIIEKFIDRPVAIPHAVYVPVHIPYALEAHQPPMQFSHLPPLPQNQYLPSYQSFPAAAVKPLFYSKPVADQHHSYQQQQPHQHYYQHPILQQTKSAGGTKQVFLPHLHSLPAHLHHYHNSVGHGNPTKAVATGQTTTHLHAARPYYPQHHPQQPQPPQQQHQHIVLPRPVYGVPQHISLAPAPHSPQSLLAHYHNQPGYAHSFGYATPAIVYRDEYRGPPPPLPPPVVVSQQTTQHQHHQSLQQYPLQQQQQQQQQHHQQQPHQSEWSAAVRRPAAHDDGELVASASIHSPQILSPNALHAGYGRPSPVGAQSTATAAVNDQRRRNLNFGKSMRWEDGFRPPLVPSVQTDEHGIPLDMGAN